MCVCVCVCVCANTNLVALKFIAMHTVREMASRQNLSLAAVFVASEDASCLLPRSSSFYTLLVFRNISSYCVDLHLYKVDSINVMTNYAQATIDYALDLRSHLPLLSRWTHTINIIIIIIIIWIFALISHGFWSESSDNLILQHSTLHSCQSE